MNPSAFLAPSKRLDRWAPVADCFRDTIVVRSTAPRQRLMDAFFEVTLDEMPLARLFGAIRYLPRAIRSGAHAKPAKRSFVSELLADGNVILEQTPDEVVIGLIGKLHQIRDQERFPIRSPMEFAGFEGAGFEKLVMSFRLVRVVAGTLLVVEHRTLPLDETARKRFGRYWKVIRPAGAFVTRQLLQAISARAARPSEAARLRASRRFANAHF